MDLKFSKHVIESIEGPLKGSTAPIIHYGMYKFKYLNTGNISSEESFTNSYVDEVYES